jgi:hypothetical protein
MLGVMDLRETPNLNFAIGRCAREEMILIVICCSTAHRNNVPLFSTF